MSNRIIKNKLTVLLFALTSLCNLQVFAIENHVKPNFTCDLDLKGLHENPLVLTQQWIEQNDQIHKLFVLSLATVWQDQPAVRLTQLYKISHDGIIFSTSPIFNMVKQFTKNPKVAVSFLVRDKAGCVRQIRAQGMVAKYGIKPNDFMVHYKDGKHEKVPATLYKITPTWMQFASINMILKQYKDIEYSFKNNKWEKNTPRMVKHVKDHA